MPVILPRIPSALIRIAIADLKKAEQAENVVVDMSVWHDPDHVGCSVCAAGAVMRGTLGAADDDDLQPGDFSGNEDQLLAIDFLRRGIVTTAMDWMGGANKDRGRPFNRETTPYDKDRPGFYRDLEKLAADLEAAGL